MVGAFVLRLCQFGITFWRVKTVSVRLPVPLASWLTQQARELRRSKSEIVRRALERQREKPGKASCLELMQDVCGSLNGPRDLSTNPKHLEGLGR